MTTTSCRRSPSNPLLETGLTASSSSGWICPRRGTPTTGSSRRCIRSPLPTFVPNPWWPHHLLGPRTIGRRLGVGWCPSARQSTDRWRQGRDGFTSLTPRRCRVFKTFKRSSICMTRRWPQRTYQFLTQWYDGPHIHGSPVAWDARPCRSLYLRLRLGREGSSEALPLQSCSRRIRSDRRNRLHPGLAANSAR